jgi:uncharacterized protein (DUF433 family)
MISTPIIIAVPLRTDQDGVIRVGNTRVTLEVVIAAHLRGDTSEQIVEGFDVLKIEDVYAVITYYLNNRDEVDEYIRQVDSAGEETRRKFEALNPNPLTREMLLARLSGRETGADVPSDFANQVRYVPIH